MADSVTKIVEQLRSEEARLEKELEAAGAKLREARADLKRVRSGIAALGGNGGTAGGKPAPKKKDVADVVVRVLQERGSLPKDALSAEVEKRLAASGFGRNGLSLRLREVLTSRDVTVDGDQVELTKPPQSASGKK